MPEANNYKYWAFISYSHQDQAWGNWLHKKLETYRVPRRLVGQTHWSGSIPRRLFPIFRDRDELPSHAELGAVINEALRKSRYQIVICSPRAAQSKWVNEELKHFKSLGRDNRVFALIVDGVPNAADDPATSALECFPPALRFKLDDTGNPTDERAHPVAADAREGKDGKDAAKLKLLAGLLGVSYDDLKQREKQRQFWQRAQIAAAVLLGVGLVASSWQAFQNYKTHQQLEAHIEKVYDLGRRELLDHHEARAAVYLNEAYKLGRDTPALRFMLGQAMQAVDARSDQRLDAGGIPWRTAFSSDGKKLLTTAAPQLNSNESIGAVWDAATGRKIAALEGLPATVVFARFYPKSDRVLISGAAVLEPPGFVLKNSSSGIWDASTGTKLAEFSGFSGPFGQPLDANGQLLVVADDYEGGSAQVYDAGSFKHLRTLNCGAPVQSASINAEGTRILTGDADGRTCLWDAPSGRLLSRLPGRTPTAAVAVMFTPDGQRALAFSEKGDVRIWDQPRQELLLSFAADPYCIFNALIDRDAHFLVTLGSTGYRVWDVTRGSLLATRIGVTARTATADLNADGTELIIADLQNPRAELIHLPDGHTIATLDSGDGNVGGAAFRPDGQQLLLVTDGGKGSLWNFPVRKLLEVHHSRAMYAVRRDPRGGRFLTAGFDGALEFWDEHTGAMLDRVGDGTSPMLDARFSPNGRRIATISEDGTVTLRDSETNKRLMSASVGKGWDYDFIDFSPDSSLLAAAPGRTSDGATAAMIWSATDGKLRIKLEHGCAVHQIRFLRTGDTVITGCADGKLRLWDVRTGALLQDFKGSSDRWSGFSLSPSGSLLGAFGVSARRVWIWGLAQGKKTDPFEPFDQPVAASLAFDASDHRVAMGRLTDNKIDVRNLQTGELHTLDGSRLTVEGLQFLNNGLLISYRSDEFAKVWDADRGELLAAVASHDGIVENIEFDTSQSQLLTAGQDGAAILWNVRSESRSPAVLTTRLRCAAPWTMQEEALLPSSPVTACSE